MHRIPHPRDPERGRNYGSASRNPLARGFRAIAFTFVDNSDSGANRIAVANFIGAGASGFVGILYLPAGVQ